MMGTGLLRRRAEFATEPSHNHQILSDDDLTRKVLCRRRSPRVICDAVIGGDQMRQYEGLDPGLLRETTQNVVGLHTRRQVFGRDAQTVPVGKSRASARPAGRGPMGNAGCDATDLSLPEIRR
jgi:hypothetical protein